MKSSLLLLPLTLATTWAAPTVKRQDIDTTVLQFALTLEHLENFFYKQALEKFTLADFQAAGYDSRYYNNIKYIAQDEESHVVSISAALKAAGVTPNAACTYSFPYTDVKSFVTLSSILEGVGVSAYLGGAPLITSKAYLTVAGSILVTEALHTSLQRNAIARVPAANPYGTPLNPSPVYTLAAAFIKSCPSTNAALPFTAFPALAAGTLNPGVPGRQFFFKPATALPSGAYATFINGLSIVSKVPSVRPDGKFSAVIPSGFGGQTYVVVTKGFIANNTITDSDILFGPVIIEVTPAAPTYNNAIL